MEQERYGKIHLTDQGLVLARTFSRKVALVETRLPRMGLALTQEELYQAACLWRRRCRTISWTQRLFLRRQIRLSLLTNIQKRGQRFVAPFLSSPYS